MKHRERTKPKPGWDAFREPGQSPTECGWAPGFLVLRVGDPAETTCERCLHWIGLERQGMDGDGI